MSFLTAKTGRSELGTKLRDSSLGGKLVGGRRSLPCRITWHRRTFTPCMLVMFVLLMSTVVVANTGILRFQVPSLTVETESSELFRFVEDSSSREQWKTLQPRNQHSMEIIFRRLDRVHLKANTVQYRRWYRLIGLERNKKYEARISYAAIHPTEFRLAVLSHAEVAAILKQDRELLEDDMIVPNPELRSPNNFLPSQAFLLVEAIHSGVSYKIHRDMYPKTPYNIVLEPLVLDLLPEQALRLVGAILCSVLFAWTFVIPAVWRIIQRERRGKGKAVN